MIWIDGCDVLGDHEGGAVVIATCATAEQAKEVAKQLDMVEQLKAELAVKNKYAEEIAEARKWEVVSITERIRRENAKDDEIAALKLKGAIIEDLIARDMFQKSIEDPEMRKHFAKEWMNEENIHLKSVLKELLESSKGVTEYLEPGNPKTRLLTAIKAAEE